MSVALILRYHHAIVAAGARAHGAELSIWHRSYRCRRITLSQAMRLIDAWAANPE